MQPWAFLLFLIIFSDMIACGVLGYVVWRYRDVVPINGDRSSAFLTAFSLLLFGIFARGMCELIASTFGHVIKPVPTTGFILFTFLGRGACSAMLWYMVLRVVGHRPISRGSRGSKGSGDSKDSGDSRGTETRRR